MKGLSKEKKRKTRGHRQWYGGYRRGGEWRNGEEGVGGITGDGRILDLGH